MPRLLVTITVVDDENRSIHDQHWSPLGYEDFNNPALLEEDPDGRMVNDFELNLLERLRVAIDRSLLRFAHGERRRNTPARHVRAQSIENAEIDFHGPFDEAVGPNLNLFEGLTPEQQEQLGQLHADQSLRAELLRQVIPKEDEPLLRPEPKPVERKSRYERKPVI